MTERVLVCNTSPLLYLGRIGKLELLTTLYGPVYVPEVVALELDAGRLLRSDTVDPRSLEGVSLIAVPLSALEKVPVNRLGAGEQAVIAYAHAQLSPELLSVALTLAGETSPTAS